jgi:hypothetical protein
VLIIRHARSPANRVFTSGPFGSDCGFTLGFLATKKGAAGQRNEINLLAPAKNFMLNWHL